MFVKGWFYNGVKVSKWENDNNGKRSVSYSIEKSYKDKATDEYKTSNTYFSNDIDALIQCLLKAKSESVKDIFPKNQQQSAPQPVQNNAPVGDDTVPF